MTRSSSIASPAAPRKRERGGAMLEMVLISPWIFFLFIGALDWGFYASALVSVQAGLRSAALYTSTSAAIASNAATPNKACEIVLNEVRKLPNIGTSASCPSTNPVVTATYLPTGPGGAPAAKVDVSYTTITLIPIPGLLQKQFVINRSAVMRVRSTT